MPAWGFSEETKVVEKDEAECKGQAAEANAIKSSCEQDLAAAIPALKGAVAALNSLSPSRTKRCAISCTHGGTITTSG